MAAGSSAGGAMVLLTAKASSRTSSAATLSSWARAVILEAPPAILRSSPSTSSRSATSLSRLSARCANSSWFTSVASFGVTVGFSSEPLLFRAPRLRSPQGFGPLSKAQKSALWASLPASCVMASITSMGWFSCPLVGTPVNSWLRAYTQRGLVVSVTQGLYAGDQAGACGRHEEDRGNAEDDARRPQAPRAEEVAQHAQSNPHRPRGQVHARAQDRHDKAARAQEQPHQAADPAQQQLQHALLPISLYGALLLHIVLPFFRPLRTRVYSGSGYLVLFWGEIQQAVPH